VIPIIGNAYTFQNNLLNQWYKSCQSTLDSIDALFDASNELLSELYIQQTKNIGTLLDSLQVNTVTSRRGHVKKTNHVKTDIAVVTGGIGGIGTAICKKLAVDCKEVIATYIPDEEEVAKAWKQEMKSQGFDVAIYECDVADFDSCVLFAQKVKGMSGHVEILVNAAGITRDSLLKKMDQGQWHAVIDTNLDSVFNVTRNFIEVMMQNKYGRIINISSVNGQKGQFGQTNYSTAKAGLIGFSRSLALELAASGITVNCICPGYVETAMVESIRQDILDNIIGQIPVGRLATPEEIADAVAFLAGRNSAYITGTELAVNGGLWLG
jgi:acetoacetyl-CoA reductase